MIRITEENRNKFKKSLDVAKENMIPMLPFVRQDFHDFDQYTNGSIKSILLWDEVGNHECLYHLYHLNEDDDILRMTLLLPTDWDQRFNILEGSIPRLIEWFKQADPSKRLLVQTLEYGEIEIFPTLSEYIMPTLLKNGFIPKYRMYMKREEKVLLEQKVEGVTIVKYDESHLEGLLAFYYKNSKTSSLQYFTNTTKENLIEETKTSYFKEYSRLALDINGEIIGATIVSNDEGKTWIDNFSVSPDYDGTNVGSILLAKTIESIDKDQEDTDIIIYLNRDCKEAIRACEKNGMVAFEFWTDLFFDK